MRLNYSGSACQAASLPYALCDADSIAEAHFPLASSSRVRSAEALSLLLHTTPLNFTPLTEGARTQSYHIPGQTAFQRVHGDSARCEDLGDREGHPGHGFEGLPWSKCARGRISGTRSSWTVVEEARPIGLGVIVVCQVVQSCWTVGERTRTRCCGRRG
ncbi:hypothetical protein FB451DRAFT_1176604 [Mycena latifolia]|nr:hypothetical protein FB451DRAFT_1176604 [Mycena latifolia]